MANSLLPPFENINKNHYHPHFITFEGPDGAGKTTVLNQIKPWLQAQLEDQVIFTREPGGDAIAEQIRNIILDSQNTEMQNSAELLLYESARAQLVNNIIDPALHDNKVVICDRYVDSTYAYQGGGNHFGLNDIEQLNYFATHGLMPALTIYYDIDPEVGLQRINNHRSDKQDRLDDKDLTYHQAVHTAYQNMMHKYPNRIKVVDGNQSVDDRVNQTKKLIKHQLKL